MHRFALLPALVLALLAICLDPDTIHAQQGGWSAKDAAAIKSYTLTMDKLRRTGEATTALEQLRQARDDDDEDTPQSIDAMAQRINAVPGARAPTRPAAPGAGASAPVTPAPPPTASPAALRTSAPPAVPISVPVSAGAFPPAQTGFVQDDQANRYDEDDAMNMPAPSAEYLAHVTHPVVHPKRAPIGRSAGYRNTLIPVLLTTAVLMLTAAVMKFVVHPDAPLAAMPAWVGVVLAAGGLAFAAVAVLYVIQGRLSPSTGAGAGTGGGRA
jgi:hypothetical protein